MSDRTNREALANDPTRRQAMAAVAMAFGGLALCSTQAWAGAEEEISRTAESIHQETNFRASRKRVYEALTDAKQFDKIIQLSGVMQSMHLGDKPAEISREVGGAFTLFGGYITGATRRACAERANRAGLANGRLGSGRLLDCEIRTRRARLRDQDRI